MNRVLLAIGVLLLLFGFSGYALDSEEAAFLSQINQYRNQRSECYDMSQGWIAWPQGSVRTLTEAPSLSAAADTHNVTMITSDCFSHQCAGEPDFSQRAINAGYTGYTYLSENIAYGTTMGASAAFTAWQNSPGHNQNMLGCRAVAIGIAREQGNDIQGWRWTTMFGDVIQAGAAPAPQPPANQPPTTPPPSDPPPAPPPPNDPPAQQPQPPANTGSGPQRYDTDGDCVLSSPEFFVALDDWLAGAIDDVTFFSVSDYWISGASVCASSASSVNFSAELNSSARLMTFSAQGAAVASTTVEVFSLTGERIFRQKTRGPELHWNLLDQNGELVANGVYLYRITARDFNGKRIKTDVQKLYILR